jgi:hypothetical protein
MSWRSTRPPTGADAPARVFAIRCPRCSARFHRSADRIPLYSIFSCHCCGSRLVRQQSLIVALGGPGAPESASAESAS